MTGLFTTRPSRTYPPPDGNRRPSVWRRWLAGLMRSASDRLDPERPPRVAADHRMAHLLTLPGTERLDREAWTAGQVRIAYRATDPLWNENDDETGMIGLREHLRRLCMAAHEISHSPLEGRWHDVAHNLGLAHSLTDLFADTDIDNSSMWCGPAAEYESVNSELAAKHLASVIVFTFVWTAYECAVDMMVAAGGGRGARGRDLVASVAIPDLPHLRVTVLAAFEADTGGTDLGGREMRRLLDAGSWPGIAAEHLRQFRNRATHGDLPKPDPSDWGPGSEYVADADPRLRRFAVNVRLTLLLIQTLAMSDVEDGYELEAGLDEPCAATLVLKTLHCEDDDQGDHRLDLDLPQQPSHRWM